MAIFGTVLALCMAVFWNIYRVKETAKPVTLKKIILPPLFMSSGALMYVVPVFRLSYEEILEAMILGLICSIFLIKTSKFEIKDNRIYLQRSKAFLIVILTLFVVRTGIKVLLSSTIDYGALSGMFFLVAFVMIVSWRIAMLIGYKKMEKELQEVTVM